MRRLVYCSSCLFNYSIFNTSLLTGASPRIFEVGDRIVGRVANLPQNTLKIGKNTGFWPLHSRIWGGVERPNFEKCGGQDPPTPRRRRPCLLTFDHGYELKKTSYVKRTKRPLWFCVEHFKTFVLIVYRLPGACSGVWQSQSDGLTDRHRNGRRDRPDLRREWASESHAAMGADTRVDRPSRPSQRVTDCRVAGPALETPGLPPAPLRVSCRAAGPGCEGEREEGRRDQ